jgi:hypothetical protein
MPVGTISLKYTMKGFPYKKTYDTRVNIKDTVEYLRFSTVFNDNAVGVAFIDAPVISAERNILINNTSDQVSENSRVIKNEVEYFNDNFTLEFASFYITDIVEEVDGKDVPMYFYHDLTLSPNISRLEILDGAHNPVDEKLWSYRDETATLVEERRGIYTNLLCSADKRASDYEVFYVKYRDNDLNEIVTVLLDSKPFYTQASFLADRKQREFIVVQGNTTLSGSQYNVEVVFDSLNFSPTGIPGQQRFYVKGREKGKIFIEKPAASLVTDRWNLRISPGDLSVNGRRYWVPEYYTQLYSPTFPFRLEKEKEVVMLAGDIIKTDLYPINNLEISGFFLYIVVKDNKGAVKRAFTNDPDADVYTTKTGFVTDVFYEKDIIESASEDSGFIKLKEKVDPGLKVYLTYRYTENWLTYSDLSVNPSINPEILGKRVILYVTPDALGRSTHHIISDDSGAILEASQTDTYRSFSGQATSGGLSTLTDLELPEEDFFTGFELEIFSGLNSGVKVKVSSYDTGTRTLTFTHPLLNPVETRTAYRVVKKVEDYTTVNILGNTYNYTGWEGFSTANFYLKLGDVFVIQNLNISDIESFDSRVLGGGVKTDQESAALQLQDEARWYWDIGNFDGTPYPGMGAVLVQLPRYILKELGGPFEREQVRDVVARHIADGSYPVIKYYDKSTEITTLTPGDETVYIEWDLIDASEYNIYIGNSSDNVFLHASQPGTRNFITIEGLENNKIFYVQIEPIVGGRARLRSRTKSFMPFNYSTSLPPIKYGDGIYSGGSYE